MDAADLVRRPSAFRRTMRTLLDVVGFLILVPAAMLLTIRSLRK
ncbi:MAG TPA: hypothetical protein VEC14_15310 [Reyranellaceae bacterium]|nr:hypothetical protein [Reyranellaceae bacterium]